MTTSTGEGIPLDMVVSWVEMYFHEECIHIEPTLDYTDKHPHVAVYGPLCVFYIEVANTWEEVLNAVGRAQMYASHRSDAVPVIVYPRGVGNGPETSLVTARQDVVFIEFPEEEICK